MKRRPCLSVRPSPTRPQGARMIIFECSFLQYIGNITGLCLLWVLMYYVSYFTCKMKKTMCCNPFTCIFWGLLKCSWGSSEISKNFYFLIEIQWKKNFESISLCSKVISQKPFLTEINRGDPYVFFGQKNFFFIFWLQSIGKEGKLFNFIFLLKPRPWVV